MKLLKKLLDNKLLLFILIFLYGSLITIFMYYPTYSLDGYCQLAETYTEYAHNFFIAGRFITAYLWVFFDLIHIPHDLLSVLTHTASIVFLSLSVVKLYTTIKNKIPDKILYKIVLLLGSTLVIYNPFTQGILVFEEAFCMSLAVYLSIISAIKIGKEISKANIVKTTILMICANLLYQGSICYFIPTVILINILDNQDKKIKDYIKDNYKKIIIYALIFGISCIVEFISLQMYVNLSGVKSAKVGKIDIIKNITIIFNLLLSTNNNMFSMINPNIFKYTYLIIIVLIISRIVVTFKKDYRNIFYIGLVVILTTLAPFVPNLVMKSSFNYTAPRLLLSFGAIVGYLIIGSTLIHDKKENHLNSFYLLLILIIGIYFFINCSYMTLYNSYHDYTRYKADKEYIEAIKKDINKYEKNNNIKIKELYYNNKTIERPNYYGKYYSINHIRVCASNWGLECGVKAFIDKDLKVKEMSENKFNELQEKETNMDFDNDKAYIIFK